MSKLEEKLPKKLRAKFSAGMTLARREGWASRVASLNDAYAVAAGCYWDAAAAAHVCAFFEKFLAHSKGKWRGEPFILLPWERRILEAVFGWKRANGTRRYRKVYIEVPKKNGKSTLAAGISLYMLTMDGEHSPEVYAGAVDRKQAAIVYNEALRMVDQNQGLKSRLRAYRSTKTIEYKEAHGIYTVLSADVATHEGLNISCAIVDELHRHKKSDLWDTLIYGGEAREQPLFVIITTAGEYDPISIGWEQHEYAVNVLADIHTDWEFYAAIYSMQPGDDWTKPSVWRKANPSLGHTLKEEDFRAAVNEAKNSPRKQGPFKRYRLNLWTQTVDAFFDIEKWKECGAAFELDDLRGRSVACGLDLSSKYDLTAFACVFPATDDDKIARAMVWHWLPEENLMEREHENGAPYSHWVDQGWLWLTPGNYVDLNRIRLDIRDKILPGFEVAEIAFDPHRATEITQNLADDGYNMVEHNQGTASMSAPMEELDRMIAHRVIAHDGNPILTWELGNVIAHEDAWVRVRPDKRASKKKIDGAVALIMALGRAQQFVKESASAYAERDLIVL